MASRPLACLKNIVIFKIRLFQLIEITFYVSWLLKYAILRTVSVEHCVEGDPPLGLYTLSVERCVEGDPSVGLNTLSVERCVEGDPPVGLNTLSVERCVKSHPV